MLFLLFLLAISTPFAIAQTVSSECENHRKACGRSLELRLEECVPDYVLGEPAPREDELTDDVKKCLCVLNSDLIKCVSRKDAKCGPQLRNEPRYEKYSKHCSALGVTI